MKKLTKAVKMQRTIDSQAKEIQRLDSLITRHYGDVISANNRAAAYLELANRKALQLENTIDRRVRKFFRILFNLEQR